MRSVDCGERIDSLYATAKRLQSALLLRRGHTCASLSEQSAASRAQFADSVARPFSRARIGYFLSFPLDSPLSALSFTLFFFFFPLARGSPLHSVSASELGRGCRAAMLISPAHRPHFGGARSQRVRQLGVTRLGAHARRKEAEPRNVLFQLLCGVQSRRQRHRKRLQNLPQRRRRLLGGCPAAVPRGRTRRGGDPSSCARLHRWRLGLLTV